MHKKEITLDLNDFPEELHPYLTCAHVYESTSNPDTPVIFCDSGFYIKCGKKDQLKDEFLLDTLFAQRGFGPSVELYLSRESDHLVTRAVPGQSLLHYRDDPHRLCDTLAEVLYTLHHQPTDSFPLSAAHRYYQQAAAGDAPQSLNPRMQLEQFPVSSLQEAWELIRTNSVSLRPDTLIHGDACLPNIFLDDWHFSAFIDCVQAGLGDRHCDLYWALWSLQFNLHTGAYSDRFLDAYGRQAVDPELLRTIAAMEMSAP